MALLPIAIEANVDIADADTEYSHDFPVDATDVAFRLRDTEQILRFSFTEGQVAGPTTPYESVPPGGSFNVPDRFSGTIYFACGVGSMVVEIFGMEAPN